MEGERGGEGRDSIMRWRRRGGTIVAGGRGEGALHDALVRAYLSDVSTVGRRRGRGGGEGGDSKSTCLM